MIRFYEMDYNNQIGDWLTKKVVEMRLAFKNWLHSRLKFIRLQSYLKPNEVVDKNNVGSLIENKSKQFPIVNVNVRYMDCDQCDF